MCTVVAEAGNRIANGQFSPELAERIAGAQARIRHGQRLRQPAYSLFWRTARAVRGRLRRLMLATR
jgi:hypothetical protein